MGSRKKKKKEKEMKTSTEVESDNEEVGDRISKGNGTGTAPWRTPP